MYLGVEVHEFEEPLRFLEGASGGSIEVLGWNPSLGPFCMELLRMGSLWVLLLPPSQTMTVWFISTKQVSCPSGTPPVTQDQLIST